MQICVTLDDWHHVTEQFSKSMSSYERALHKRLSQEIVPYVVEIVEVGLPVTNAGLEALMF